VVREQVHKVQSSISVLCTWAAPYDEPLTEIDIRSWFQPTEEYEESHRALLHRLASASRSLSRWLVDVDAALGPEWQSLKHAEREREVGGTPGSIDDGSRARAAYESYEARLARLARQGVQLVYAALLQPNHVAAGEPVAPPSAYVSRPPTGQQAAPPHGGHVPRRPSSADRPYGKLPSRPLGSGQQASGLTTKGSGGGGGGSAIARPYGTLPNKPLGAVSAEAGEPTVTRASRSSRTSRTSSASPPTSANLSATHTAAAGMYGRVPRRAVASSTNASRRSHRSARSRPASSQWVPL